MTIATASLSSLLIQQAAIETHRRRYPPAFQRPRMGRHYCGLATPRPHRHFIPSQCGQLVGISRLSASICQYRCHSCSAATWDTNPLVMQLRSRAIFGRWSAIVCGRPAAPPRRPARGVQHMNSQRAKKEAYFCAESRRPCKRRCCSGAGRPGRSLGRISAVRSPERGPICIGSVRPGTPPRSTIRIRPLPGKRTGSSPQARRLESS